MRWWVKRKTWRETRDARRGKKVQMGVLIELKTEDWRLKTEDWRLKPEDWRLKPEAWSRDCSDAFVDGTMNFVTGTMIDRNPFLIQHLSAGYHFPSLFPACSQPAPSLLPPCCLLERNSILDYNMGKSFVTRCSGISVTSTRRVIPLTVEVSAVVL